MVVAILWSMDTPVWCPLLIAGFWAARPCRAPRPHLAPAENRTRMGRRPSRRAGGPLSPRGQVRRLPRLDPAAERAGDEHAEDAAGVVEFLRLLETVGQERLVQGGRPGRARYR